MTKDKKSRIDEATQDIDLRLGGLLGQLGSALTEALSRLEDQGEVHHETTFDSARGPIRASAGIRIRTLGDAKPSRSARRPDQPVNAAPRTQPRPSPEPEAPPPARPISATILTEGRSWRLIAELPGVAEADVTLGEEAGDLVISASGRGRRFEGRFALPSGAKATDLTMTMQNGILELARDGAE
jgi:HSP20 family molecular chaperone IbpA